MLKDVAGGKGFVNQIHYISEIDRIIVIAGDCLLIFVNPASGAVVKRMTIPSIVKDVVLGLSFSAENQHLRISTLNRRLMTMDVNNGEVSANVQLRDTILVLKHFQYGYRSPEFLWAGDTEGNVLKYAATGSNPVEKVLDSR